MKQSIGRKSLVVGIIVLFIGASVIPAISGNTSKTFGTNNEEVNQQENFTQENQSQKSNLKTKEQGHLKTDNIRSMFITTGRDPYGWEDAEVVSTTTTDSTLPSIAVENDGTVHVVWEEGGNIYYRKRSNDGTWGTVEDVREEVSRESHSPSIVVFTDAGGKRTIHVVWSEYPGSGMDFDIYYREKDENNIWQSVELVSSLSPGWSYQPSLVIDNSGTLHVAWSEENSLPEEEWQRDIFYTYKHKDQDETQWDPIALVAPTSGDSVNPDMVVADDLTVHVVWEERPIDSGDIDIAYKSKEAGGIWEHLPNTYSEPWGELMDEDSTDPALAIDDDGRIYLVWADFTDYDGAGSDEDIFISRGEVDGAWTYPKVVSTESINNSWMPTIDVHINSSGGETLHVAWSESPSTAADDIYYKNNTDIIYWSSQPTEVVSTEGTGGSYWPSIAVDSANTPHVAWVDTSDYDGAGSDDDIFYKLKPSSGNYPPEANFTYSPPNPDTSTTIQFTDTSTDDGTIVSWDWDFDDGDTSILQNPTHKYDEEDIYDVTLIVTDDKGLTGSVTKKVYVGDYTSDLIVEKIDLITFQEDICEGDIIEFHVTIRNQGDGPAFKFHVNYLINDESVGSVYLGYGLDPGLHFTHTFKYAFSEGQHGSVTFKVIADSQEDVPESNEDNNENSTTFLVFPIDYLSPEGNKNILQKLKEYYDNIVKFIEDSWEDVIQLANPFLSNKERQEIQDRLAEDFPDFDSFEEEASIFYSFINKILHDHSVITFTPDPETGGTLITIDDSKPYPIDFDLSKFGVDEIKLDASLGECTLTFSSGGKILFTITLEPIFQIYPLLPPEIGVRASIDDLDIFGLLTDLEFLISFCPSFLGIPTLALFGEAVIEGPEFDVTLTFNDPISLRNAAASIGVYVGADISGYAVVGGGVSVEAGAYASLDFADFYPLAIEFAGALADCLEAEGGTSSGGSVVDMLKKGINVGACLLGSPITFPESATVGVEFGIGGQVGLGVGGSAANTGAKASIDATGSLSAGISAPINVFADEIYNNRDKLSKFFEAVQTQASILYDIYKELDIDISKSGRDQEKGIWDSVCECVGDWEECGKKIVNGLNNLYDTITAPIYMIDAFMTALETARELKGNIPEPIRKNVIIDANLGIGVEGEAAAVPKIAAGVELGLGAETNLETVLAVFTLDVDTFLNEGYGGIFLSDSLGLGLNLGPIGVEAGASKDILKFAIQGTSGKSGREDNGDVKPLKGGKGNTTVTVVSDYGTDLDIDGFYDYLTIDLQIDVNKSDTYVIAGFLFNNFSCVGYVPDEQYLTQGVNNLSLHFDGLHLRNEGINGTYGFGIITGGSDNTTSFINLSLYNTSYYSFDEFEETSLTLTGVDHEGVDTDSDGYYNYLQVDIDVDSSKQEQLYVVGFLSHDDMFVTDEIVTSVTSGTNEFSLSFDGEEIRKGGRDSPFVFSVNIYNQIGVLVHNSTHIVSGYSLDDFEKPPVSFSDEYNHRVVDLDGDTWYDQLEIDVGLTVDEPGVYTVKAFLIGNDTRFYLSNSEYLSEDGFITLTVDGKLIRNTGKNQIFSLYNVVLYEDRDIYGIRINPYNTTTINYYEFDYPDASFTEIYSEQAVDENSNGLDDYLRINVGIVVEEEGFYKVSGYLKCGETFIYSQDQAYYAEGVHTVPLIFDGRKIYESGYSGVYRLQRLGLIKDGTFIDFINQSYNTTSYTYTSFEHFNRLPTANFTYTPSNPAVGDNIQFDASPSSDPDGSITDYWWDLGDGTDNTGQIISYSYTTAGSYAVKLIVTDDGGAKDAITKVVKISGYETVGHWHFDEGTGSTAYDDTSYGNDGTITGATWEENGTAGTCLYFDGSGDYVTVSHSASLDITDHFCVEAWINVSSTATSYRVIVDKYMYQDPYDYGFTFYVNNDGRLRLSVYSGASGTKNVFGTSNLRDDTWHHVAGLWNGTHICVYVDGVLEGQNGCTNGPASTTQNLGIGRRLSGHGGNMDFKGSIDEVRIIHDNKLISLPPPDIVLVDDDYNDTTPGWGVLRFSSIQAGIDAVSEYGTVVVANGTYYETCTIAYKTIDLIGAGPVGSSSVSTIIDGQNLDTVFTIDHSDWVNVSGLQIINSGIGMQIKYSNHNTIFDNQLSWITYKVVEFLQSNYNDFSGNVFVWNDPHYGIRLSGSSHNYLSDNLVFSSNDYGIYLTQNSRHNYLYDNHVNGSVSGISLMQYSSNNTLIDNRVWNSEYGIYALSSYNTLTDNRVSATTYGIGLITSRHNYLANNTASENSCCGIYLDYYCSHNTLYNNSASGEVYGIYLHRSSDNTLLENSASAHDEYGLYLYSCSDNTLSDNYAGCTLGFGVGLDSSCHNILTDNQAGGKHGIGLFNDSCDNNLTGNWATSDPINGLYGIYIGAGSNNNNIGHGKRNWVYGNEYGIYITSSSDNLVYANDVGSELYPNEHGIYLDSCNNNNISTNNVEGNKYGLYITGSSSQNEIYNNVFDKNYDYAIYIDSAYNANPIRHNFFIGDNEHGLMLDSSTSQTIVNNFFFMCGIHLTGDDVSHWNTHTITDNNVSGREIRYYKDKSYMTANITDTAQVILANCHHMTVKDFSRLYTPYYREIPIILGFSTYNNITNNTILYYDHVIYLEHSSHNNINNNTIEYDEYNEYGIYLLQSSDNNITFNIITSPSTTDPLSYFYNGILLENNSNDNNISHNSIDVMQRQHGINIESSSTNIVFENTIAAVVSFWGTGVYLTDAFTNHIVNNEIVSHSRGIHLVGSQSNEIFGNNMFDNWNGIYLLDSHYNIIALENYIDGGEHGIWLEQSSNNLIDDNTVINHQVGYGISLWDNSILNTITHNIIENNGDGVFIVGFSNDNDIYHNDIISNTQQAYDECMNNWNHEYQATGEIISGGNYWDDYPTTPDQFHGTNQNIQGSDGIGDAVGGGIRNYTIPGTSPSLNVDDYPFVNKGNSRLLQSLYDAADTTDLLWTTGGHADWLSQEEVFYYDGSAAQSGPIADQENSWIKTFVYGPGNLTFYWNVSSVADRDFLWFYIDTIAQASISGNGSWTQKTYDISSGYHDLVWQFTRGAQPQMHVEEDFDDTWPPEGWTIEIFDGTGIWEQIEVGDPDRPGREPFGATGYYAVADSDFWEDDVFDVGLRSPTMDLSEVTGSVYLDCDVNFQHLDDPYHDYAEIRVWSLGGDYLEETLAYWDYDTGPMHFVEELNVANYVSPSDVQIEFHYSTGGGLWQWWFSVDNVLVYEEERGSKNGKDSGRGVLDCGWLDLVEWTGDTPPYVPSNPSPPGGAIDVNITTNLSWTGGDPDPGDTVTYDVYFGTTSPPPKVVSNQTSTVYDPGTLNHQTTYYWQIVAWDNHSLHTDGPIWNFTTESIPGLVILYPTDDTYVDWYMPDEINGHKAWLIVRPVTFWEISTLIKFNLSSIPQNATIDFATLNLYHYHWWDANPAGRSLDIHHITSDWDEDTVTYNTRPSFDPSVISSAIVPSVPPLPDPSGEWMGWNLTSEIQDMGDGVVDNYGWQISGHFADNPMIYFRSKENITDIPYLEVHILENNPPDPPSSPYPENGSTDIEILPTLNVTVNDPDGDELDVYWYSNSTGDWILFDANFSVDTSGGVVNVSQINDNFDRYGTTYWWSVNVTDGIYWVNITYHFTTINDTTNPSIEFVPPTPEDGTTQSEDYIEVNLSVSDESELYAFVDFDGDLGFWMRMDDVFDSTVVDSSSYGNNGTAVNEAHQVDNGRYGKGFDFDGDGDYIEISETSGLDFAPGSFTISAWIKPRDVSSGWLTILEHGRLVDNWFGIWINGSSSKFHLRVGRGTTDSDETLVVDRWYHVVGVYNASSHEAVQYIDGEFDSVEVVDPGIYWDEPANQSVTIGVRGTMDDEYFDGVIDDVLIFDRVLNEGEIQALYSIKTLDRREFYDRAYGNWLGQIAGNFLGRETEGDFINAPNPADSIYYSPYSIYITGTGDENDYENLSVNSQTDDDTSMEWVDLWMLENYGLDITYEEVNASWQEHITTAIWFANRFAYMLMTGEAVPQSGPCDTPYECTPTGNECPGCCGCIPPFSGMEGYNPYFDYIDAQIESEVFGVLSPGMVDSAERWGDWFARVTNDEYAVDFAKFYSMMYANAIFEDNITRVIETVTSKFPSDSKVVHVVENVTNWYNTYSDWRDTRDEIHSKYYIDEYDTEANGRSAWWIHSTHNFAATIMSLLYGNGDFDKALQISALAGWDNDCNAATVGGLMGAMLGAENIPHKWRYPIRNFYENTNRNPEELGDDTLTNMANRTVNLGELIIMDNGGNVIAKGEVILYEIPSRNYGFVYHNFTNLSDGTYRFTGYAVDRAGNRNETMEREVTIQINNPPNKPSTPSGPTLVPAGYEQVYNTSTTDPESHLVYYKWDWDDGNISDWIGPYPSGSMASANHTWTDLGTYNITVKAKDDPNGDGDLSDGLESPWSNPLLVNVVIPGDLDGDGDVDLSDLAQLLANYGTPSGATYEMGDIDGDGDVDLSDLAALLANYGYEA